jgi:DNA-binding transcriptional MerR regulator
MNREEKERYVIQLYNENRSTREIAGIVHMSFRDIGAITKKLKLEAGAEKDPLEIDDFKSKSKTTQAIALFSELKTPLEVAIALDLAAHEVRAIYREYWELDGMYKLAQIYDEAKYDLHDLLRLYRIAKGLGMNEHDIRNILDIVKNNRLQILQREAERRRSEINMLETEKTEAMSQIFRLKRRIHESEETLAQKRKEMARMKEELGKYDKTDNLSPITHSEPDTNSHSTRIVPYNKE